MVVSNSSWLCSRAAEALVWTDSSTGEVRRFPPPRTRGSVPRALTFSDYDKWPKNKPESQETEMRCQIADQVISVVAEDDADSSSVNYSKGKSFLVTSSDTSNTKMEIDDPPEAYESFEIECIPHRLFSDNEENYYFNDEVPSMSTPTEHYSKALEQKLSHRIPKLSAPLSSGSDGASVISSPLIHSGPMAYLSLDELVDIYTKKMQAARELRAKILNLNFSKLSVSENSDTLDINDHVNVLNEGNNYEENNSRDNSVDASNNAKNEQETSIVESDFPEKDLTSTINLVVLDMELLLDKLDEFCDQHGNSFGDASLRMSVQDFESLLTTCSKSGSEYEKRYELNC